jgi:hypothetical protein
MTKLELVVSALAAIGLIGLIVLLSLGQDVTILTPIVTALMSFILGAKKDTIALGVRKHF